MQLAGKRGSLAGRGAKAFGKLRSVGCEPWGEGGCSRLSWRCQLGLLFLPAAPDPTLPVNLFLAVGQGFSRFDYWEPVRFLEVNLRQDMY